MKDGLRLFQIPLQVEQRIFLFLISAVAFTIPFKAIYNSVLCIVLFIFWIFFMKKKFQIAQIKSIIMISLLFWTALIGMVYTQNMDEGWFRLQQKSLLLLLPLVFGTVSLKWNTEFRWGVSFFILGVLVACLVCLTDALIFQIKYQNFDRFFSHGLVEFIDLYTYIMALLCLLSILILAEALLGNIVLLPWLNDRYIALVLILFFSIFLFLLSVKQLVFAWIIFLFVYSVRVKLNKQAVFAILSLGFVLATLSICFIPTLQEKLWEVVSGKQNTIPLDQDSSLGKGWNGIAMRKAIWICSVEAISKNSWLGAGTGDGQDELQAAYENRQFYFASRYNHFNSHNQYLQVTVVHGLVGLALWLVSLFWIYQNNRFNWILLASVSCFLLAMLTESMLETNKGILIMTFIVTILLFGQPVNFKEEMKEDSNDAKSA